MQRSVKTKNQTYDVVVVGGGLSGMCAAIAAARHGAKTGFDGNILPTASLARKRTKKTSGSLTVSLPVAKRERGIRCPN